MRRTTVFAASLFFALATIAQPQSQPAPIDLAARLQAADVPFQKEDWSAAVKAYESILADVPAQRLAHFRLGYALHMLKRVDEALPHHLAAAQINNRALRIDALYNVACANALLGRKPEALRYLQNAIDTGFADVTQIRKDSDFDSIRADAEFQNIVATIGKTPTLPNQLEFLIGTWTARNLNAAAGQFAPRHVFGRPAASSYAISSVSTLGAIDRAGLLTPNYADRTWRWISADGMGTTRTLIGRMVDETTIRFEGRDTYAAGDGPSIRMTITRESEKRIRISAEIADKPDAWTAAGEEIYERE